MRDKKLTELITAQDAAYELLMDSRKRFDECVMFGGKVGSRVFLMNTLADMHKAESGLLEASSDEKTGEAHKELTFGEFTAAAANALDKRDRDLLVRQRRHMGAYQATLEQRMERICKRLSEQKGKRAGDVRDSMEKRDEDYRRHHAEEPGSENPVEVVFIL